MRKTRLSIRRGGAVGVTSPAQCSLTVLWQVAFHHQHQSITVTTTLPPPPPPPGRNLHGIICRGVTAAGRHRARQYPHSDLGLDLAIIFIFWTYVLSLNQRLLYFAYPRQNILLCKCGQWTLDRHKSCKRKEILTHNSSFFQLNEVCHSVERECRVQQHGMKTYCLQIFSKSISFGCSRKKRFSPSGFWNKHMFNFYIFHNVPVPPQKIIFINFYGLNVRGILWPWRRM